MGAPLSGTNVEAFCWDITMGAAGTGIGQRILSMLANHLMQLTIELQS